MRSLSFVVTGTARLDLVWSGELRQEPAYGLGGTHIHRKNRQLIWGGLGNLAAAVLKEVSKCLDSFVEPASIVQ